METQSLSNDIDLQALNVRKAALVYRAINHKLRQQILALLHKKVRTNVTTIYTELRIEQSVASQHLAILRKGNIVKTERDKRNIYYSVNYGRIKEIEALSKELLKTNHQ